MSSTRDIPGKMVDGVFNRVLAGEVTPALQAALKVAGIDLEALAPSYPRETWYQAVELAALALFPGALPQSLHRLGRHIVASLHRKGLIKGPWVTMAKLLGPRRALLQAAELGGNRGLLSLRARERGAREVDVDIDEGVQREFLGGLLEGIVELLGGKGAHARITEALPASTRLAITWK